MEIKTDFLILGSGIAGLSYALKVCSYGSVAIVTKKEKVESSTNYAQGGIASVLGLDDSFDFHIADTLTVGEGLSHPDVVESPFPVAALSHGRLGIRLVLPGSARAPVFG